MKNDRSIRALTGKIAARLRDRTGESFAETMAALLISSLALAMLAGAITGCMHLITRTRARLGEYYQEAEALVGQTADDGEAVVTIKEKDGTAVVAEQKVICYGNEAFSRKPVISYKMKPEAAGASGEGDGT